MVSKNNFESIDKTIDGYFKVGINGVQSIMRSYDRKFYMIYFENGNHLMGICTKKEFTTYYPLASTKVELPIKAILMDLDGTTLYSEDFWISIIEKTVNNYFFNSIVKFTEDDYPFVSGHSVTEHLEYCKEKYGIPVELHEMMNVYQSISKEELKNISNMDGAYSITPAKYLKEFLFALKKKKIKIGLVTSGLYEKAYPEILAVCNKLKIGKPEEIYDCIITTGYPLGAHNVGTLGELSAKPHPWLYLESLISGLGLDLSDRNHVIGIEDSAAGVCALRSAGIPTIGITSGNIIRSGVDSLCNDMCSDLKEILIKYIV